MTLIYALTKDESVTVKAGSSTAHDVNPGMDPNIPARFSRQLGVHKETLRDTYDIATPLIDMTNDVGVLRTNDIVYIGVDILHTILGTFCNLEYDLSILITG